MLELLLRTVQVPPNNTCSPDLLLAGTCEQGYYGEVPASEFISGSQLATNIGLTAGTAYNTTYGWLKFSLDYKTLYVAKRPLRYALSWDSINAIGAVFGEVTVNINGLTYKVRLLKGRGDGLTTALNTAYDAPATHGSEWNRLMYHISASPNGGNTTSEGISVGDWAKFSDSNLGVGSTLNGSANWCQENSLLNKVTRGRIYVSSADNAVPTNTNTAFGWRPCLELIE